MSDGVPETRGKTCSECRGAGRVLLLFSWSKCPACDGSGKITDDDADTQKHPIVRRRNRKRLTQASAPQGSGQGSGATTSCDPEDDPSYFDDGLEFDDHDGYGGGDASHWEGED